jgi:hypothetical protein
MRKFWRAAGSLVFALGFVVTLHPEAAGAAPSIGLLRNDYNRDGISDLVGVRDSDGCLARWRGTGNGGFTYIGDAGCGWDSYHSLTGLGDFNRDGVGDLVAVRETDGCLARWRGNGAFGFTYIGDYGCGWDQYHALGGPGDINGDGIADLIAVRNSDGCVARWLGTGGGGFTNISDLICNWPTPSHFEGVGDINADGRADVIGLGANGCIITFLGDGRGGFYASATSCDLPQGSLTTAVGMGDVNRDGLGDFVASATGCLERWTIRNELQLEWVFVGFPAGCGWGAYTLA